MKKSLENLISEFFEEYPESTLYIRKDLIGHYEVGVAGENHTHALTVAEGIRFYWGSIGLAQPACSVIIDEHE